MVGLGFEPIPTKFECTPSHLLISAKMHSDTIILVMGLPASGKSTFCRKLSTKMENYDVVHLEYDAYLGHSLDFEQVRVYYIFIIRGNLYNVPFD